MTGSLIQLVAISMQDAYLTGMPQFTYFKNVYRRYTNFATESVSHLFNSYPDFDSRISTQISRTGDLLYGLTLETTLPNITCTNNQCRWIDHIGHYLVEEVSVSLNDHVIDRHYSDWMEIWSQLTVPAGQYDGYLELIGHDKQNILGMNMGLQRSIPNDTVHRGRTIYVPLKFWFCRNIGSALPLVCLQNCSVKIDIKLAKFSDLFIGSESVNTPILTDTVLWADFVYLDTEERRRFAQSHHEYLIDYTVREKAIIPETSTSFNVHLPFKNPVKELIWIARAENAEINKQWVNYTNAPGVNFKTSSANIYTTLDDLGEVSGMDTGTVSSLPKNINILTHQSHVRPYDGKNYISDAYISFNGNMRMPKLKDYIFNKVQPLNYHKKIPYSEGINVYSFALSPNMYQPSGSCNFSAIYKPKLHLWLREGVTSGTISFESNKRNLHIYALTIGVLRIMGGMAGLAHPR